MSSAICFNLDQSKILSSGDGLNFQKIARNGSFPVTLTSCGMGQGCGVFISSSNTSKHRFHKVSATMAVGLHEMK